MILLVNEQLRILIEAGINEGLSVGQVNKDLRKLAKHPSLQGLKVRIDIDPKTLNTITNLNQNVDKITKAVKEQSQANVESKTKTDQATAARDRQTESTKKAAQSEAQFREERRATVRDAQNIVKRETITTGNSTNNTKNVKDIKHTDAGLVVTNKEVQNQKKDLADLERIKKQNLAAEQKRYDEFVAKQKVDHQQKIEMENALSETQRKRREEETQWRTKQAGEIQKGKELSHQENLEKMKATQDLAKIDNSNFDSKRLQLSKEITAETKNLHGLKTRLAKQDDKTNYTSRLIKNQIIESENSLKKLEATKIQIGNVDAKSSLSEKQNLELTKLRKKLANELLQVESKIALKKEQQSNATREDVLKEEQQIRSKLEQADLKRIRNVDSAHGMAFKEKRAREAALGIQTGQIEDKKQARFLAERQNRTEVVRIKRQELALESQIAKLKQSAMASNRRLFLNPAADQIAVKKIRDELLKLNTITPVTRARIQELQQQMKMIGIEATGAGAKMNTMTGAFQNALLKFPIWMAASTAFFGVVAGIRSTLMNIIEIDKQMISLQRVSNGEIDRVEILRESADIADRLGNNLKNVNEGLETFARQGFRGDGLTALTEASTLFGNISDLSIEEASSGLTAAIKGFQLLPSEAMRVVDAVNEVDNNFAISSANIVQSIQKSVG